ncbi:MAG: hypothetical protein RO257_07100 [Candidatus Kapabacteria bacterium]|nr:hypothetical protein [Candidatus Kapabacteria bacterium]
MYKIITILSVLLLIQISYCFSDYVDPKEELQVKGGYKSCKIYGTPCTYDGELIPNSKRLVEERTYYDSCFQFQELYDENGTKYMCIEMKYNEAGFKIEKTTYEYEGKFLSKYRYNLDTNGYVVKAWEQYTHNSEEITYDRKSKNNKISIDYEYFYFGKIKNIIKSYFNDFDKIDSSIDNHQKIRYKYDKNGNEIEQYIFNKNDSLVKTYISKYNERQKLIEYDMINYWDVFWKVKFIYIYDDNGFLIEHTYNNGKNTFKNDQFGNIIQATVYNERGLCNYKLDYVYSY